MVTEVDQKKEDEKKEAQEQPSPDLPMKARFARFNSPFLQLMLSLLTTRYAWTGLEDINPGNFLRKPNPADKSPQPIGATDAMDYARKNFAALGIGTTMLGIVALYSQRTFNDIKTIYSEAVGYELDKNPKDVTWNDVFLKSKNAALGITRDAFVKRTLARTAASASFLFPWQIFRDWKNSKPKYDANVNTGIGTMGTYLTVYEGFIRTPSFFDLEQELMGKTASYADTNGRESIKPRDIRGLLLTQRKHLDKKYTPPALSSPEGLHDGLMSERIADLMNQTYTNTVKTDPGNFTIGKLNFLVGFGLLEDQATGLAYIELANQSTDMKDVKTVAAAIKNGLNPKAVFQEHGIDITNPRGNVTPESVPQTATTKFAEQVQPLKDKLPQAPRTGQEFAAQTASNQHQI